MIKIINERTETIRCPDCGSLQFAKIEQLEGMPFLSYVHRCDECQYLITESEWETIYAKRQAEIDAG